jgi:hypothetical protein
MALSPAAAILMVGGLASLTFAALAGFGLYWIRVDDVTRQPPRYALVTHTSAITHGLVLIALAVVIPYSGLNEPIQVGLAGAEVAVTVAVAVRNVMAWRDGITDGFADVSDPHRRLRGLANVVNLVVVTALLYGVIRTALGI